LGHIQFGRFFSETHLVTLTPLCLGRVRYIDGPRRRRHIETFIFASKNFHEKFGKRKKSEVSLKVECGRRSRKKSLKGENQIVAGGEEKVLFSSAGLPDGLISNQKSHVG
jgi:hypothetical protein